jgi:hypothetical protein
MKKFSETNIGRIGDLLKKNANESYTVKDISLNLKINPKSVSSSLSRLKAGKDKTGMINGRKRILKKKNGQNRKTGYEGFKIGTIKNTSKGRWEFLSKIKYKLWEVSFKVIDTSTKDRQRPWITEKMVMGTDEKAMDLHGIARGIVPIYADSSKVEQVAANRLLEKSLDVIRDTWGLIMYKSIDPAQDIFFGTEIINHNPLDQKYDRKWDGMVYFKGSHGFNKKANVTFNIDENRY